MLQNILKWGLVALFGVTALLVILFYAQVVPLPDEASQMEHGVTDAILGWALALFIVCAIAAIVFPIVEFAKKPDLKTIVMIGAVALVCIIAYAIGDSSIDSIEPTLVQTNETELKWSDAGLWSLYILLGVSLVSVVYAEVAKKFN